MLFVCLFAVLLTFVSTAKKSCTDADRTLLNYIDWQMKTFKYNQSNKPGKCVCKPKEKQPIAFFARLGPGVENLPKMAVVIFKTVVTNEGKAYNPTTGIFTCPEDGVYSFAWTILTEPRKNFNTVLVVDGAIKAFNNVQGGGIPNSLAGSQTAIVNLKRGNKVSIRTHSQGKHAEQNWSSFCGYKL